MQKCLGCFLALIFCLTAFSDDYDSYSWDLLHTGSYTYTYGLTYQVYGSLSSNEVYKLEITVNSLEGLSAQDVATGDLNDNYRYDFHGVTAGTTLVRYVDHIAMSNLCITMLAWGGTSANITYRVYKGVTAPFTPPAITSPTSVTLNVGDTLNYVNTYTLGSCTGLYSVGNYDLVSVWSPTGDIVVGAENEPDYSWINCTESNLVPRMNGVAVAPGVYKLKCFQGFELPPQYANLGSELFGYQVWHTVTITVNAVNSDDFRITSPSTVTVPYGEELNYKITSVGGSSPITYSLTYNPSNFQLYTDIVRGNGTPGLKTYFTVKAVDSQNRQTMKEVEVIFSSNPDKLTITSSSGFSGVRTHGVSYNCTATGGLTPYAWSTQNLPSFLNLSGSAISGTIPLNASNKYTFSIVVTDSDPNTPSQSKLITLTVTGDDTDSDGDGIPDSEDDDTPDDGHICDHSRIEQLLAEIKSDTGNLPQMAADLSAIRGDVGIIKDRVINIDNNVSTIKDSVINIDGNVGTIKDLLQEIRDFLLEEGEDSGPDDVELDEDWTPPEDSYDLENSPSLTPIKNFLGQSLIQQAPVITVPMSEIQSGFSDIVIDFGVEPFDTIRLVIRSAFEGLFYVLGLIEFFSMFKIVLY